MKAASAATAMLVVLLGGPLLSPMFAPAPKAASTALYPLELGFRWVYRSGPLSVVRKVTAHDRGTYTMQFDLPLGRFDRFMRHTREGVVDVHDGAEHLIMRFPMRIGDRWVIDIPDQKEIAECEVVGREELSVLGRTSLATKLRVVRTNRASGKSVTDYEWYADGIGLVQMKVTYVITATFKLESFDNLAR